MTPGITLGGGGLHRSLPVIRFTAKEGGERWS